MYKVNQWDQCQTLHHSFILESQYLSASTSTSQYFSSKGFFHFQWRWCYFSINWFRSLQCSRKSLMAVVSEYFELKMKWNFLILIIYHKIHQVQLCMIKITESTNWIYWFICSFFSVQSWVLSMSVSIKKLSLIVILIL